MRDHVTHHDDCGCQSAALTDRIATLEAELAAERKRANDWMARVDSADHDGCAWMEHANRLREALAEAGLHDVSCEMTPGTCRTCTALAQTPAASLAAHDAEVLDSALSGLPAGYYVFRKKHDAADSTFDVAVLTTDAVEALGDLGVTEAAFSLSFAKCVEVLEQEVKP